MDDGLWIMNDEFWIMDFCSFTCLPSGRDLALNLKRLLQ